VACRLLVALVVGLPLLVVAPLAFAADGEPTISFTVTGTPPLLCGTRPSVSSLSVLTGTKIIIANLTGVAATVNVGTKSVLELSLGMGAVVELKQGQHDLRLIPHCAVLTRTEPAVVTVLAVGQPPDVPPPDEPAPAANPDDPVDDPITMATPSPTGTAGPAVGGSGVADPGAGGTTAAGPGVDPAGPMAPSGAASGVAGSAGSVAGSDGAGSDGVPGRSNGSVETEVIDVQAIDLGGSRDPKGVRLLAVIAAICVFGVTAAIIRAIVSQRTSSTVPM
jgi:hypothetical protein